MIKDDRKVLILSDNICDDVDCGYTRHGGLSYRKPKGYVWRPSRTVADYYADRLPGTQKPYFLELSNRLYQEQRLKCKHACNMACECANPTREANTGRIPNALAELLNAANSTSLRRSTLAIFAASTQILASSSWSRGG